MDNDLQQNIEEKVFFKIIIPNYNNMPYIKKCLDSILEQTFQDFKIIIVDDMSTDLSDRFCEMYARRYSNKIAFQQLKNKGYAGTARNIGLDYPINCKYILFVDSDDWLYNGNVLYQIYKKIINSSKNIKLIKLAMFTYFGENNSKNYVKKFNDNLTLEEAFYNGCGPGRTCISSDLAQCKFKENRRIANDVIWFMRCIDRIKNNNLLSIEFPWAVYNRISTTSGTNLIKKYKTSKEYIFNMTQLLDDLINEKFTSKVAKNIQRKLIKKYSIMLESNLNK